MLKIKFSFLCVSHKKNHTGLTKKSITVKIIMETFLNVAFVFSLQMTLFVSPLLMESENLTALKEEVHKPKPQVLYP